MESNLKSIQEFGESLVHPPTFYSEPIVQETTPYVFWTESIYPPSTLPSSSSDPQPLSKKIVTAFSRVQSFKEMVLIQFWAVSSNRKLSIASQPFAVSYLTTDLAQLRNRNAKITYEIEVNHHMIIMVGLQTPYKNCLLPIVTRNDDDLITRVFLPVCDRGDRTCIGVVELNANTHAFDYMETFDFYQNDLGRVVLSSIIELRNVGLDIIGPLDRISCMKDADSIMLARRHIENAVRSICDAHRIPLAQGWVLSDDWSFKDFPQHVALKLLQYSKDDDSAYVNYSNLCDVFPQYRYESVLRTIGDGRSRLMTKLYFGMLADLGTSFVVGDECGGFVLCIKCDELKGVNFAIEFLGLELTTDYINYLEGIHVSLAELLPTFKLYGGASFEEESLCYFYDRTNETKKCEDKFFKLFEKIQGGSVDKGKGKEKEEGKGKEVVAIVERALPRNKPLRVEELTLEDLKTQIGVTRKQAQLNLQVSNYAFRGAVKRYFDGKWPQDHRKKAKKGKPTLEKKKVTISFKATFKEWSKLIVLPEDVDFKAFEDEISKRFELKTGSFKLEYVDSEKDYIWVSFDDELERCKKSMASPIRIKVTLRHE